jgi:hypothetical protein
MYDTLILPNGTCLPYDRSAGVLREPTRIQLVLTFIVMEVADNIKPLAVFGLALIGLGLMV